MCSAIYIRAGGRLRLRRPTASVHNPTEECSSSFDNIKTSTGFVCKRQVSKLFRGLNNRFENTFVYRSVSATLQQNSPAKFATKDSPWNADGIGGWNDIYTIVMGEPISAEPRVG